LARRCSPSGTPLPTLVREILHEIQRAKSAGVVLAWLRIGGLHLTRADPRVSESGGPSARSLRGLDAINFLMADVRDGVGPYLSVFLKRLLVAASGLMVGVDLLPGLRLRARERAGGQPHQPRRDRT
jgi:hypothetical protein